MMMMMVRQAEKENIVDDDDVGSLSVGDHVSCTCNWYQDGDDDQWYDSVVLHVDVESRTTHVRTEDGDEIEYINWDFIIHIIKEE